MNIKIADTVFEVETDSPYIEQAAKRYITDEPAEYKIHISPERIQKKIADNDGQFSEPYTEWLEIYRDICVYFEERDGILMHGAVIGVNGAAYIFTAPSGTGKTTHIRLWKRVYGDAVTIVNGDKPVIRLIDGEYFAYGTPWCGKENYNVNTKLPLRGVILVSRGTENKIERVNPADYIVRLLKQVYVHKKVSCASNVIDFADRFFTTVPVYSLSCNMEPDAARVAHDFLIND